MNYTWGDRDLSIVEASPTKGLYYIIVGTQDRNVIGATYKLNVNGQIGAVTPVLSQDICADGNINNGGGLSSPNAPQNATYAFDVTEDNSSVDFIIESPDFNLAYWLYNPLGQRVSHSWGDRSLYDVQESGKGKWKIVVGTQDASVSGKFKICLVGKFQNFRKE